MSTKVDSKEGEYRMYFVVNPRANMGKGKVASQVGHAVSYLYRQIAGGHKVKHMAEWYASYERMIVCKATPEQFDHILRERPPPIVVKDAGLTQVDPGTITVIAYYPLASDSELGKLSIF